MATNDPKALLKRLLQEPAETPWLEFKRNNSDPDLIGRTISACANSAMLVEQDRAFIVWGIENKTKKKVGTTVRLKELTKGAENLENWLNHMIEPRLMMELIDFEEDGKLFSIISFEPTYSKPVKFYGVEYIRIGENVRSLKDHEEHAISVGRHR